MNILRRLRVMRRHAACDGPVGRAVDAYAYAYECERRGGRVRAPERVQDNGPVYVSAWGINRRWEVAYG
jgi:hypothetical protein